MTIKIDQLVTYLNNIKTEQIQAQILENIKIVAELSGDEKNQLQLELFLKNKHMIEFNHILHLFCIDIEAQKVAQIVNVARQTINIIFHLFRKIILKIKG
jgi:hypothetical protein